ncbi:hypothetical protein BH11BAC5_BH11BAC5_33710 [soil metagenome]
MKTSSLFSTTLIILSFSAILLSCKKDNATKSMCRITRLTGGNIAFNYKYNPEGKLSTIIIDDDSIVFSYNGSIINENVYTSGVFSSKDVITLNANGMPSNVRSEGNATGTVWDNFAFEYNGTEVTKQTRTNSAGAAPIVTTYTWRDGNLVVIVDAASTARFEYFNDKPATMGDYISYLNLQKGYQIFRTKNSPKALITSNTSATDFNYTYDSDGKITALTAINGATEATLDYQYECK